MRNIKWIFFDMGSTLIDESAAMEHRIREVIAGTEPANQLGMFSIWIKQGSWKDACPKEELEIPVLTVNSLTELCKWIMDC